MTATGFIRGHAAYYNGSAWRYQDNDEPAGPVWGGDERPCPKCGQTAGADGYDPCLGFIESVMSACCGHGVEEAYVLRSASGRGGESA